jgi:hypothetical protein
MCGKNMGKYKQWLQYRKADQELRTELAHLEKEQQQLAQQIKQLASTTDVSPNSIIQALLAQQQWELAQQLKAEAAPQQAEVQQQTGTLRQVHIPNTPARPTVHRSIAPAAHVNDKTAGTVSPALHAWSNLPNFDTHTKQKPIVNTTTLPPIPDSQPTPDTNATLLPADVSAFVDAHSTTDPQLKVPWWLRNMRSTPTHKASEQNPIDQQSARTNQSVERFFQRWNDTASHPVPEQQHARQTDQIKPVLQSGYSNQQRPSRNTGQIPPVQRPGTTDQIPPVQHANNTGQLPSVQHARNTRQSSQQQQSEQASNAQKEWRR